MWFNKKITVPKSDSATKEMIAVQLWEVRWCSRYGKWADDLKTELEGFPTQQEAERFAESLRMAFRILRYTCQTQVTVEKGKAT